MYYSGAPQAEVEDIIMDFLVYRKNKRHSDIRIQSDHESESNQSDFKPLEIIHEYLSQEDKIYRNENVFAECEKIVLDTCNAEKTIEKAAEKAPHVPIMEGSKYDGVPDSEAEYMNLLYTETNKRIYPYVDKVICEYEYPGSLVFEENVDSKVINEMVEKTLELAAKDISEINEIRVEMHRHPWSPHRILRACVESLLLNELFYKRKLMYVSVPDFSDKYRYL